MGKFLAGLVVGLVAFEAAYYYGFMRQPQNDPVDPRLPADTSGECCTTKDVHQLSGLKQRKTFLA